MFPQWGNTFQGMDPSQQMYWQQYYGYQQAAPMWGSAQAPQPASGVGHAGGAQASPAGAVALPPEPPKDEAPPPPLPADPPPPPIPEEPQPPPDSHEQQKLTALQQQAAQWQQQKQWQEYQQSLLQYQQQLQQWNAQQASILEQIHQEEKEFEMQYSDWMKQYNDWKEQNKNHPNRDQYLQYEQQWKQYEEQMAQKREFIKQRKTQALMNQQMAQAPTTSNSGFGGMTDQGVSAGVAKPPESKPEPVSASSASSFASSGFGGGMIYTSSGGQPSSAYPPSSSGLSYSGYGYGGSDYAMGQGGAANTRFPQPPGGHLGTSWPDQPAMPPAPPQGGDQSWNQTASTADYGMKHQAGSDFGMHAASGYEGQRQPASSDFGIRKPGPTGFGMTPQHSDARGPTDPNTGQPRSDFSTGSDEMQNFMRNMEMPPSSSSAYQGNFRTENQLGSRFQQHDMNSRFPGPRGPGMNTGMLDSSGRLPGPHGMRMPQQDSSMSLGPSVTSSSDSSYTGHGQGADFSQKDANASFSSAWGSASGMPSYDASGSHIMGPPHFPGPSTNQQSSEYDNRGSGPMGARMPFSSQQSSQFLGPSSSEQSKPSESGSFYPGMPGPRFPQQPSNAPDAVSSSSGFLGNRFDSRSSTTQQLDARFPGPRMPNQFSNSNQSQFDSEHASAWSDESQNSMQPGPGASRFSGPRGPGMGPDIRHNSASGQFRFSGPFGPGVRPDNEQSNSGGMRYPGPRGPGFQQEQSFGNSRYPGPRGPGFQQDFQQDRGFSDARFPQPHGPGMGPDNQQHSLSGPRFPGPQGPRVGADFHQDNISGEAKFPGPRGPGPRPEFGSGDRFPRPRGPDFQQEPRFLGSQGPRFGADAQQDNSSGESKLTGPRGPGPRPEFGSGDRFPKPRGPDFQQEPRFSGSQGPRFGAELQQDNMSGDSKFPGPRGSGPRPEFGSGDRFPRPRGPDFQQEPRFPGSQGPRFGANLQQDTSTGAAKFTGPRGPGSGPELGSGDRFPRPRGPDFQQESRFRGPRSSGPFGMGCGPGNQQGGMRMPGAAGIDSGSRFSQQGPRGPNNFGLNEQKGPPEAEKKFSGLGPPTSGPRPLLAPSSVLPSSVDGVKTSAHEPFGGRAISSQSGPRLPSPSSQSSALILPSSDVNKKSEVKGDTSKEAATPKPSESLIKPDAGPNKEPSQGPVDSSKVPSSTSTLPSSSTSQNFQLPGQGVRPSVGSQGHLSTAPQKFDSVGRGVRPPGPRVEGPDPMGLGRPPGPRLEGPDAMGRGVRPPGQRLEGPDAMGRGVRPPGPRLEGPDAMGRGVRPPGQRFEGPDSMGRGFRPPGPRGEGPYLMGRGIRPPGAGVQPRFPGGHEARASTPGPRGLTPDAGGMKFAKWQAPGGAELEEMSEEVEDIDPELEHHAPVGFDPRGRMGFGGGPRFPTPSLMSGLPRAMRPPFPRGLDPRFRPRMPPGVGAARMQHDLMGVGSYSAPVDPFSGDDNADYGTEEQEDFSQDYGEEGFFGKRKGEEVGQEFGIEETYEEDVNPPAAKFGRMDPGLRPPFPRMPMGRGFVPRGQRFDVPVGGPMGMRPRFDTVSGRPVRPPQHRGGPVPLMLLSVRPAVPPSSEQPAVEDAEYGEEEYAEELETEYLEAEAEVLESGHFMHFGPRGPHNIRGGLTRPPMGPFGPRGIAARWPRPSLEEFHPGMGRGGLGNMRGPRPYPGFGDSRIGFADDSQNEYTEEAFIGLQPPDATYDEEGNLLLAEENWDLADYTEEQGAEEAYGTDDATGKIDSDGAPIQFSEREHELIKKAAEELKLLTQTLGPADVLPSKAPVPEKPKPPPGASLSAFSKDDMRDETEESLDFKSEREYLDRDDRFIRGERPRGHFHDEPSYPEEEYGAEAYAPDPYRGQWHEEDLPRRPMPPDLDFRGPMRDFEPGFDEPPWREDPDFRDGRFPRNAEDFDRVDRRPFEGRWGPPPDWDRRSPPERGPRGAPLPPLPNPREFLENLEGRARPPSFGHGPPPRPPPFDAFPPSGTSAVFDYGHGEPAGDPYGRHPQSVEPEEFWPDRDEDMRFRAWERDRDLRHERDLNSGDFDRERRPPFPDIHERGGWPEHREREFPGSHERDRGSRSREFGSRGSSDRGSREPSFGNREHRSDRERELRDRERDFRDHDRRGGDRDEYRDRGGRSGGFEDPLMHHPGHGHQGPPGAAFVEEPKLEVAAVDDLLVLPGRRSRPDHIVVIIRGPPGAGKTFVSKLLKDKEVANGGTAPRMLCLDDYFMVETEKMIEDPETGKKTKKTVMEYEFDPSLEPSYKISFLKSFKRQIDDCYFNFIVVDAIFDKTEYMDEFWSYAKSKGFQVYVVEMQAEIGICAKRNTHQRKQSDIQKILDGWDETPRHYIRLDVRSLLQDAAIEDVEMEDTSNEAAAVKIEDDQPEEETEEEAGLQGMKKSKWEMDTSEQHLDKLDGIRAGMKNHEVVPQRLEDYLQLPDDYDSRTSEPGKKRVRWADIEERKDQLRRRELGFVIGQTDWAKMTDDSYADRALNRTKYF